MWLAGVGEAIGGGVLLGQPARRGKQVSPSTVQMTTASAMLSTLGRRSTRLAEELGAVPAQRIRQPTPGVKNSLDTSQFVFLTPQLIGVA